MSASEAKSFFDSEVKPVSWAWRNGPPVRKVIFTPRIDARTSSAEFWRDRAAKYEATVARDSQRERQDALSDVD